MNSRERVTTTLDHKEPDKIPIDIGGNQSGINIIAYKKLLEYLDISDNNIQFCDYIQQLALPCEELLQRFEVDFRWLRPPKSLKPANFSPVVEGKFQGVFDQLGVFWGVSTEKSLDEVIYLEPVIHPFEEMKTVQEIKNYNWPDGKDRSPLKGLRELAKKLREKTPYALTTPPIGCIYEYTTFLFGLSKVLRYLRKNQDLLIAAMEELEKYWSDYATTFLNEIKFGKEFYVDIVSINGDLAHQAGPFMNPKEIYEPLIKPIEHKLSKKIHAITPVKINYHSCGSIVDFIPHFIDIGYEVINPVQISAYNMDPCSLKKQYGNVMSFWGGLCDTQETLPYGTTDRIRNEVKHNIACLKPGGGYIASNIHNILAEVPPQNIVTMFDTLRDCRDY
jgi:uroporphyrinogen decarboxylase